MARLREASLTNQRCRVFVVCITRTANYTEADFFPVIKQQVHPDPVIATRPAPSPRAVDAHTPNRPRLHLDVALHPTRPHALPAAHRHATKEA